MHEITVGEWEEGAPCVSNLNKPFFCARDPSSGLVHMLQMSTTEFVDMTPEQTAILGASCPVVGMIGQRLMTGLPGQLILAKHIKLTLGDVILQGLFGETADEAAYNLSLLLASLGANYD